MNSSRVVVLHQFSLVRTIFWGRKQHRPRREASRPSAFREEKLRPYHVVQPWIHQAPSPWSTVNKVPNDIEHPSYAISGEILPAKNQTNLESVERISGIRKACKLARTVLNFAGAQIKVGLTTSELDNLVFDFIVKNKAFPSPLGYRGYPKSICTSVNNVVCHGIPDSRPLMEGDIINVDITEGTMVTARKRLELGKLTVKPKDCWK